MLRFALSMLFISALISLTPASGDWWSDNGDSANAEDIDSGAKPETSANDDLVRDARGTGQPDDSANQQLPMVYDSWGRPFVYGMPYGYGPGFGYGMGYMSGPYPQANQSGRR